MNDTHEELAEFCNVKQSIMFISEVSHVIT